MNKNALVLSSDRYMFPAAAFLADKLASLNPRSDVAIAILSDSEEDLEKAADFRVPAELIFGKLPVEIEGQPTERITVATFFRLFVPDYVGDTVERILCLDVDMYPENDAIFGLFDLNMDGHSIAATRDIRLIYSAEKEYLEKELAKARVTADRYLNGGLQLIDRRRFIEAKVGHRAFKLAAKHYLRNDLVLNRIIAGKWLELSPAVNAPLDLHSVLLSNGCAPSLTHFIGSTKPWHGPRFASHHPARREVEAYILRSPWRDFLSRHYDFRSAWDTIQSKRGGATFAAPPKQDTFQRSKRIDFDGVADYLRNTGFADVKQGITELRVPQINV